MTDEELDALMQRAHSAPLDDGNCFICYEAANAISTLREQLAQTIQERDDAEARIATLWKERSQLERKLESVSKPALMRFEAELDHVEGHIRTAKLVGSMTNSEAAEWLTLDEVAQQDMLWDCGHIMVTDYSINSVGNYTKVLWSKE